ncbi:ExeA family protein [Marinobacter sp. X15-166B]|uniref:ExeA family protein n=1 Tax=Marinobacter sp. X15-166B TaxID=1897620 RepID=UPI00085CC425|nr:AAA family ATPase [Marinobacter sp. X15-166B]OEY67727.1 peptidoglycan-binding protein [Marinobacter sp. X15-166B]
MYYDFFGFREPPFSIAPDPRYLYLSERHKEALAHLMYGVRGQGGFIVITGEVGTGKTTISRCFIDSVPDNVDIAIVLNPRLSVRELLSSICDELRIAHPPGARIKPLVDLINADLLEAYAAGRHKVLLIDEAQNLSAEVLEQLRLLTNLETAEKKLLQIILLGQPELQDMLARPELRQLNQRVTARYHLGALARHEVPHYLRYRLSVAGQRAELFSPAAIRVLFARTGGIPRLINLISDRALLGAYAEGEHQISGRHIKHAAREILGTIPGRRSDAPSGSVRRLTTTVLAVTVITLAGWGVKERYQPVAAWGDDATAAQTGQVERDREPAANPITAAVDAPLPEFTLAELTGSRARAFAGLYSAWGEAGYNPQSGAEACRTAAEVGLACLARQGTRRSLEMINRPAVLTLRPDAGEAVYVTVLQLAGDTAVVATERGPVPVSFARLEQHWFGEFVVFWRLPPYRRSDLPDAGKPGEELWLSTRLMQLADLYGRDDHDRARLKAMGYLDQVRWYQGLKGLEVDGIAGGMTLVQINSDLDPEVPKLLTVTGQN